MDAFEGESANQFLARHVFAVVFRRPAQQTEKIDEGFREESGVAVSGDADHRTVAALGELGSVGGDEQRKMRKLRRLGACAFEDEHVLVGVGEMVLAANNVADAEVDVVGAGGEVVGGHAVGTKEREVFDVVGGFGLLAVDRIMEANLPDCSTWNTKAKREGFSGRDPPIALRARKFAHARVEEPGLIGSGFLAVAGVGGGEVAVSQALLKDGVGNLAVQGQPFGLLVLFVPTEVEPAQTFEDGVHGGIGVALDIGVVKSQDHGSSVMVGIKPVENEGAGTTDVQKTSGRRRESNAKHNPRV